MMTTLKKGSKGEEVKILQRALNITPQDGIFGPATEKAVIQFQKSKSLTPDGVVGPKTWEALGVISSKSVDPSVIYYPLKACLTSTPNRTIKYIAVHYTAGSSSAPGFAKTMKNSWEVTKRASADFGVDDRDIVQFNPDPKNYSCWSVGDKKTPEAKILDGDNRNTVSIEICSNLKKGTNAVIPNHAGWYYIEASLNNALKLIRILMKKYNIPKERVVRHYDISGKLCPGIIGWNNGVLFDTNGKSTGKKNNSSEWENFKKKL